VRKILSLRRVADTVDVPNISNDRVQWAGNMGKGECCFGFGERVRQFITGKSSVTGEGENHWKLKATLEERESERSQTFQKDFGRKIAGAVDWWRGGQVPIGSQLGKEPIESGMFSDGSDTIPVHVPVQETQLRS